MRSIIPSRRQLMAEYRRCSNEYEWLNAKDCWATVDESRACYWHGNEMEKLAKVLDALHPGWREELDG